MSKSYKSVSCTGTVSSVDDAYSTLEDLANECREIVDNAEGGLAETQRIQTFEETASTLEGMQAQDVPQCVADLTISYSDQVNTRKRAGPSRAVRCSNACGVLSAAAEALQNWLDEEENAEHDDRDEVETLKDQLESDAGEAEGCEFPGMFG